MNRRSVLATTAGLLTASSAGCLRLSNQESATATPSEAGTGEQTDSTDEETLATITGAPMFQYDAANTGTSPDETGPQTTVGEQWFFETGGSVEAPPAVVDGTVYVGSHDANVYALSEQ
jgi:outer membrane protein assembly factor BamB